MKEVNFRCREATHPRKIIFIAENHPGDIKLIRPQARSGFGFDGIWTDDFHHAAIVSALGRGEAYYEDYRGCAQEFISLYKRGVLYQGQSSYHKKYPGTLVLDEPASAFIFYLENHDQISNELMAERFNALTDPARYRILSALLLLAPETPLIFMGQEFASSKPFNFFADYKDIQLVDLILNGRKKFMAQLPTHEAAYLSPDAQKFVPSCCDEETFLKSKLDFNERIKNAHIYQMYYDLLKIRRENPMIASQNRFKVDGAVLEMSSFVIRYYGEEGDDCLLLANLFREIHHKNLSEPLLAPSKKGEWQLIWSSQDPNYGGPGITHPCHKEGWIIPGLSVTLLKAVSKEDEPLIEKKYKIPSNGS